MSCTGTTFGHPASLAFLLSALVTSHFYLVYVYFLFFLLIVKIRVKVELCVVVVRCCSNKGRGDLELYCIINEVVMY